MEANELFSAFITYASLITSRIQTSDEIPCIYIWANQHPQNSIAT